MSSVPKPHNSLVIPPHIQHGIDAIRENGLCGEVSHNLTRVCLKDAGHEGEHGDKDWPVNLIEPASNQQSRPDVLARPTRMELIQARLDMDVEKPNGRAWYSAYKLDVAHLIEQHSELERVARQYLADGTQESAERLLDVLRG